MLIYQNKTTAFVDDIRDNKLTDILIANFHSRFGHNPAYSEINSWQNSLPRVRDLIELADLTDNTIAVEYEVPYNQSRIDCLLFGRGEDQGENVVLIELKQWTSVVPLDEEGNFVETYTGGGNRVVPHPAQQVKGYHQHLTNFVEEFSKAPPLALFSCSYCHNYSKAGSDGIFAPHFEPICREFPVYCKQDTKALADRIKALLAKGDGFEIFNRFMQSRVTPSRKLLENVSKVVANERVFSLLNEQIVAKNLIWSKVKKARKTKQKSIIIVHGGPGTGKSVIAVNVLAEAAQKGLKKIFYGCKSKPFTTALQNLVGGDTGELFSNLNRFLPTRIKEDEIDLLLVDEAHRIVTTTNNRFTKAHERTDMPQIDQLVRCARVAVFFIDDKQNVRAQEVGSSELIRQAAGNFKGEVDEVELVTQFRCMGSNDYLEWIESALGFSGQKKILRENEVFDFQIFDSPQALYDVIAAKEKTKPNSARLVAGYCWPWSDPNPDGTLVRDVQIGSFQMPWEAKEGFTLAKGIPKWYEWAYKTRGVEQVGCIYTAQGFEFDYIGVIVGPDLVYDKNRDCLTGDVSATCDPTLRKDQANFSQYARNIYRVLMTRGMKGCYVYFVDKDVERFFRERMGK